MGVVGMTFEEIQAGLEKIPDEESQDILEDMVHDICSRKAAEINNGGHLEQIRFIQKELGEAGLYILSEMIKGRISA
jgi:hypothetical protein